MNYEMKNFSKISITNDELILEWDKGRCCATKLAFALSDIAKIGIDLKPGENKDDRRHNRMLIAIWWMIVPVLCFYLGKWSVEEEMELNFKYKLLSKLKEYLYGQKS